MFRNHTISNTYICSHGGLLTGAFYFIILDLSQTAEIHPDCVIRTQKRVVMTLPWRHTGSDRGAIKLWPLIGQPLDTHKLAADWSIEEAWHRSADRMFSTRRV